MGDIEQQLESGKATKGCIISIANETNKPLQLDRIRVYHGKMKVRPDKTIEPKHFMKFGMEGERSIEAKVSFKWRKGYTVEIHFLCPKGTKENEYPEGVATYHVSAKIAKQLNVIVPRVGWDKITHVNYIIEEIEGAKEIERAPSAPPYLNHSDSSEFNNNNHTENNNNNHVNSNGNNKQEDFFSFSVTSPPLTARDDETSSIPSFHEDDESHRTDTISDRDSISVGGDWSDEEEEEPKRPIQVVIKPKSSSFIATPTPTIAVAPPANITPGSKQLRRRSNASMQPPLNLFSLHHSNSDNLDKSKNRITQTRRGTSPVNTPTSPHPQDLEAVFTTKPSVEPKLVKSESITGLLGLALEENIRKSAGNHMACAFDALEEGKIELALDEVHIAMSDLITVPSPLSVQREIEYCIRYQFALQLLQLIDDPKSDQLQKAFLARILATIALRPLHRVISLRLAIRFNLNARNYQIAADLIEFLIDKVNPVDKEQLQQKLEDCVREGRSNADQRFSKHPCPICSSSTKVGAFTCSCGTVLKTCAKSFTLITAKTFYTCRICKLDKAVAGFAVECPQCHVGNLEFKMMQGPSS